MAAGKLTPFYVALVIGAVLGGILIARSARGPAAPTLSLDTRVPLTAGPRGITFGSDSAPVELIEFSDFECPWCARYAVLQMPDVKGRLVPEGRLRIRFVHFPLNIHAKGPLAHLAAACANEQGRFWEMHDQLFSNQSEWVASNSYGRLFSQYAGRIGLDQERFDSCVSEQRAWPQVLADKALGDSIGVGSTPTFVINGRVLADNPTYDALRRIVDSLAPAAPAPARRD